MNWETADVAGMAWKAVKVKEKSILQGRVEEMGRNRQVRETKTVEQKQGESRER